MWTTPPTSEFLFALRGILSHPSMPRYVYSFVVDLINQMLNSAHRDSFWGHTFHTSREHVESLLNAHFPSVRCEKKTFTAIDSEGNWTTSSTLVFNAKDFIMEDVVRNLNLLQPHKIALNPNTMWTKKVAVVDEDGKKDCTETIATEAYSRAHQKFITREDQLLVPYSCWIDETGITSILTKPTQPLLIKNLLFKREFQTFHLWAYIPCPVKGSAEKKLGNSLNEMNNYHRALEVAFADFDEAAEYFNNHKQTVCLGGTKKDVFIVPVILVFLCDNKSIQIITDWT